MPTPVQAGEAPIPAVCPIPATAASSDEPASFHLGYRRWLDGLRGVAILLVVFFHLQLLPGGALGVDLFFVLSGFLITNLLVEEWLRRGSISLKRFYFRRALRLLPGFIVLLLVFIVHTLLTSPPETIAARWHELAVVACYVANWNQLHGASLTLLGHTWSLSVEEQFYLLWPVLLCLLLYLKVPRRHILILVIGAIIASAMLRLGLHNQHRFLGGPKIDIMRLYAGLDTRADALLAGCLAGLVASWNWLPTSCRFIASIKAASVFAVLVLAFCLLKRDLCSSQYYDGLFTVVALMTAILIIRLLVAPSRIGAAILESAPLVSVGRISYGLYLFHAPVIACFDEDSLGWRHLGTTALAFVLSVAAALLSFYLVERPFLRLKDRLGAPAAVPAPSMPDPQNQRPGRAAA
jgi:peptidoglycan/LPS O-acetylase OafA/YrhL